MPSHRESSIRFSAPEAGSVSRSFFRASGTREGAWTDYDNTATGGSIGNRRRAEGQAGVEPNVPASARTSAIAKEVLDPSEETCGLGMSFLRRQFFEFGEQFALLLGEILRGLDHNLHVH